MIGSVPYRATLNGRPVLVFRAVNLAAGQWPLVAVPAEGGRLTVLEAGSFDTAAIVIDGSGQVVARAQGSPDGRGWALQVESRRRWRDVTAREGDIRPELLGLGRTPESVLVRQNAEPDVGLYEVDLNTGAWTRLGPATVPARSAIFHPLTRRLLGVVLDDEQNTHQFEDAALQRRWTAVARAFPGARLTLGSLSDDLAVGIVQVQRSGTTGDDQYVVNLAEGRAELLGESRPALVGNVGQSRIVRYAAADGLALYGLLTLPSGEASAPSPLVILVRDEPWLTWTTPGFDPFAQAMASRGYAVLEPNYRGSAYPRPARVAGAGQMGRAMQTDLSDGIAHLASESLIDPARVCIVGAGYGGYAALLGVMLQQDVYRCAAAIEPWADLRTLTRIDPNLGSSAGPRTWPIRLRALLGIQADIDESAAVSPLELVNRTSSPILLVEAEQSTGRDPGGTRLVREALRRAGRPAESVEIGDAAEIFDFAEHRLEVYTAVLNFLEQHNPPR